MIRSIQLKDKLNWERLWSESLASDKTALPDSAFEDNFARLLLTETTEHQGLIAEQGGVAVGLAYSGFQHDNEASVRSGG